MRNRFAGVRWRPGASSIGFMALWPLASSDSTRVDMPITPTLATSPSSNALVACVVEWARKMTSLGSTPDCSSTLRKTSTTPFATPRGSEWVVSTGEPADHLMGRIVDQDSLGEGPADIDTDTIGAGRRGRSRSTRCCPS